MVLLAGGRTEHRHFFDLPGYLEPGDLLVLNRTRVLRARLFGRKAETGGQVEVLLLRPAAAAAGEAATAVPAAGPGGTAQAEQGADWSENWTWEALVRPGRRIPPGTNLVFPDPGGEPRLLGQVAARTPSGGRVILFQPARTAESFGAAVEALGQVPLPPYITRQLTDPERYQTVFASVRGSVAAPTAGLHFTPAILDRLAERGVRRAEVTLHIGLDTFRPVREENVEEHRMHSEWYEVPPETAEAVRACRERGGRVAACGTTVVRTLESAALPGAADELPAARSSATPGGGLVSAQAGETKLFIYPGYRFRVVDRILTNFHLPRSTLLMLVSAFGGTERTMEAYREAARMRYRFYSFGDAMLIFPGGPS